MKRAFLLGLVLVLFTSVFFASEKTGKQSELSLHIAPSIFLTNVGLSVEHGRSEYDLTFSTSFPNMIPIGWIPGDGLDEEGNEVPYTWRQLAMDAWQSLTLMGLVHGDCRHDLLKSDRHDLDVGVGLTLGAMNLDWEEAILAFMAEGNLRYTRNFRNGNGLFFNLELPVAGYLATISREGMEGEFFFTPLESDILILYGFYVGCSMGYRISL